MSLPCSCPWDNPCWFCEDQAETRAAEDRGEFMSEPEADQLADELADQYERWLGV